MLEKRRWWKSATNTAKDKKGFIRKGSRKNREKKSRKLGANEVERNSMGHGPWSTLGEREETRRMETIINAFE